jgi:DNA-directed RNA polymerase specialized sigma24 family protein
MPDEDGRLGLVREVLRRLPKRDRLLLALRAHDLSYRDIAAAAGIRQASVGRLLARAVARWEEACQRSAQLAGARGIKPERHQIL